MTNSNPKWALAAFLMAQGIPKAVIARKLGVARQTINNWLKKEEFQNLIQKAREDYLGKFYDSSIADMEPAKKVLLEIMGNEDSSDADRIRCARTLLHHGTRVTDMRDFGERIKRLEDRSDSVSGNF
jgi:transcriptional regulator with XRE-family HTH domain